MPLARHGSNAENHAGSTLISRRLPASSSPTIYTCAFTPKVQDDNGITRLTIRLHIKRLHGRRALLSPDGHDLLTTRTAEGRPIPREHIVHAIGLAHAWRDELLRTRDRISDIAPRWGLTQGRVHRLLTLAQLTPALLSPALRGNLPTSSSLDDRTVGGTNPDWQRQATHRLHPPTTDARRHKRASLAKARPLGTMRRKAFLVVGPLVAIP